LRHKPALEIQPDSYRQQAFFHRPLNRSVNELHVTSCAESDVELNVLHTLNRL